MIIILRSDITSEQRRALESELKQYDVELHPIAGKSRNVIALVGDTSPIDPSHVRSLPGVADTVRIQSKHKLVSRETHPEPTIIRIAGGKVLIGAKHIALSAGPCSVDTLDKLLKDAEQIRKLGIPLLRGGAFKPRTSPYDFQGHGEKGLEYLAKARDEFGLPIITEVMTVPQVPIVAQYADVLQIGTRNMQNFNLLEAVGQTNKTVLLKRGMAATFSEWLFAAEYIMKQGNRDVILCERGIRTFEDHTRNTLPLASIPAVRSSSHLPIMIDPSHGTGKADYVPAMCRASIAAGADGLIIEATDDPAHALSDGAQTLDFKRLADVVADVRKLADLFGMTVETPA